MRILRVHGDGTDEVLARSIGSAIASFNAALDIRLRFLAIGVDEVVLDLRGSAADVARGGADAADASERVGRALADDHFDLVVLLGGGTNGLAAATVTVRAQVPLVRVGAGMNTRVGADDPLSRSKEGMSAPDRAIDQLSATHLVRPCSVASGLAPQASMTITSLLRRR